MQYKRAVIAIQWQLESVKETSSSGRNSNSGDVTRAQHISQSYSSI